MYKQYKTSLKKDCELYCISHRGIKCQAMNHAALYKKKQLNHMTGFKVILLSISQRKKNNKNLISRFCTLSTQVLKKIQ